MDILKSGIQELAQLDKISRCAWHIKIHEESKEGKSVFFILQDVNGKQMEIPVFNPYTSDKEYSHSQEYFILIMLAVIRIHNDGNVRTDMCYPNNWNMIDNINRGRSVAPYEGEEWINKYESRLYDLVQPEYII